jgi:hypothetical protein
MIFENRSRGKVQFHNFLFSGMRIPSWAVTPFALAHRAFPTVQRRGPCNICVINDSSA